ncbi:MAG: HDIG domain-containing protein [Peptococcaceae bacterium]|nr:HDIG domain-containing protein [Peptococcaceae bacterium]
MTYFVADQLNVMEGEVSPSTIEANRTIIFEDVNQTEENRQNAAARVPDIHMLDQDVIPEQEKDVEEWVNLWRVLLPIGREDRLDAARPLVQSYSLREEQAEEFFSLDLVALNHLRNEAASLMESVWSKGVRQEEVEDARRAILDEISKMDYDLTEAHFLETLFNCIELRPNYIFNEAGTIAAREEAARRENPVLITVRKNQKIVDKGEVVTAEQIEILRALGYQRSVEPYLMTLGALCLAALMAYLAYRHIRQYHKNLLQKEGNVKLLALLFVMSLFAARLATAINTGSDAGMAELSGYLIPAAMGSILVAILLDSMLAVYFSAALAFFIGIMTGNQIAYAVTAFVGSLVGVYIVSRYSQRTDWVKAGIYISLTNCAAVLCFSLINNSPWQIMLWSVCFAVISGFVSPVLAYGSLPFLESAFKITSMMRLMELANPNQPLLKELLVKAPGTYNHCIMVGNLAEAAADAVGADTVLVRAGAYYHDIGKIKRPYFFVENQLSGENPHDKLTPALSAMILASHVKDGADLARQNNLPESLIDFISQHHGTSVMKYFYHKALETREDQAPVAESDFRYGGPKPQSKETALVMLADNVEAAIRSMNLGGAGQDKLETAVRKIIKDRLDDGQLDESDLTMRELTVIAQVFCRALGGMYHSRVEYPDNVIAEMEKGKRKDEDSNTEPAEADPDSSGIEAVALEGTPEDGARIRNPS